MTVLEKVDSTDGKLHVIGCHCGRQLTPEQSMTYSWRVHCKDCDMMTGWFKNKETAMNIWMEFCNKSGNKIRMSEAKI